MEQVKVSLFLDTREGKQTKSAKRKGAYSVTIRIWDPLTQSARIRKTGIELSRDQFNAAWTGKRLKPTDLANRGLLHAAIKRVTQAVSELEHFNYEKLDKKLSTPRGEVQNVVWHLEKKVTDLTAQGRIGTAHTYKYTGKWVVEFAGKRVPFGAVTPKWLEAFEDWALEKGRSITTVGMYVRNIRVIFNDAIEEKIVDRDQYPFGKRRYIPPASRKVKKALTQEQLRTLMDAEPKNKEQQMAKDFFFFSYGANGMNVNDIAHLKQTDMEEDHFHFIRGKTKNSKRDNRIPIVVYFNPLVQHTLEVYGQLGRGDKYVFPFITDDMDNDEQYVAVRNFTRFINQHIRKLASDNDLPPISSNWARHSFATVAIRKGASLEFMRECLGHSDQNTTQNYFAGFGDEAKKEFANSIMDF